MFEPPKAAASIIDPEVRSTPESRIACAVFKQAMDDIKKGVYGATQKDRRTARLLLTSQDPEYRALRNHYAECLGVDGDRLAQALRERL